MLKFEKFTLANGLRVIVHEDKATPMAAMNILFDVGARDEDPKRTGFAHLFEHLMFGGSMNIESYDEPSADGRRRKQCLYHQRYH
jgi:zinc protease